MIKFGLLVDLVVDGLAFPMESAIGFNCGGHRRLGGALLAVWVCWEMWGSASWWFKHGEDGEIQPI